MTKQRNYGIERIGAPIEVVCFLDDDTVLSTNYFEEIIKTFQEHQDVSGVGGVAINENSSGDISMSFVKLKNIVSKTMDKNGKVLKEKVLDIKSLSSSDSKTRGNSYSLDSWYDNFFIASGPQKVTSKTTKEKKDVFILSKLSSDN